MVDIVPNDPTKNEYSQGDALDALAVAMKKWAETSDDDAEDVKEQYGLEEEDMADTNVLVDIFAELLTGSSADKAKLKDMFDMTGVDDSNVNYDQTASGRRKRKTKRTRRHRKKSKKSKKTTRKR